MCNMLRLNWDVSLSPTQLLVVDKSIHFSPFVSYIVMVTPKFLSSSNRPDVSYLLILLS